MDESWLEVKYVGSLYKNNIYIYIYNDRDQRYKFRLNSVGGVSAKI